MSASARPRISLVTPSFNQARFIERTLQSVLDQKGDFDLEYLVFDGGSRDWTLDILRRYGGRLQWTSAPDRGQVEALNKGLRACTGDYVGWLNSDDVLLPGALARVVAAFAAHPEAVWVHGRCEIIDAHDHPIRKWVSAYKHRSAQRYSYKRLLTENFISQMTVFWRRGLHEKLGYLDPRWELAFDYDWVLRLAEQGPPVYLPERLACFRMYETSKSGAQFRAQLREAYAIACQHDPGRTWQDWVRRFRLGRTLAVYTGLRLARQARERWSGDDRDAP